MRLCPSFSASHPSFLPSLSLPEMEDPQLWAGACLSNDFFTLTHTHTHGSAMGHENKWKDVVLSCCVSLHSRVRSAVRSPVHVPCGVHVLIGCVHSCYVLCCVACSLCFSLAVCFHVVRYSVNTWLISILISCVFVSGFAHVLVFLSCMSTWVLS